MWNQIAPQRVYKKEFDPNVGNVLPNVEPVVVPVVLDNSGAIAGLTARENLNERRLGELDGAGVPEITPRREVAPLRSDDVNPYFNVLVAYHQAKKRENPDYDPSGDSVYKQYHDNWRQSLQKGAGFVYGNNDAPVPQPPVAPEPRVFDTPPQAVSWAEPRQVPQYGAVHGLNTQLTRLPCADGNCGPAYTGREAVVSNPRMSILGAFALADILKSGNANVNAANQHYDQMAIQMYANDPTFQRDVALGVQRGLNPEEAYHAAVALRGYASGNNNLANATYTQNVLPAETRNAQLQIGLADEYGVPYQAQPGLLGDVLPLGGVYSITPNTDGTRNVETPNFGFINAPRTAATAYSILSGNTDPAGFITRQTEQEAKDNITRTEQLFADRFKGNVAAAKASEQYLDTVVKRYGGKVGENGLAGMSPKDMALTQKYLEEAKGAAAKNRRYAEAEELDRAIKELNLHKTQLEYEIKKQELAQATALTGGSVGGELP